jgi:ABC-type transporter Mla subunit MlaD
VARTAKGSRGAARPTRRRPAPAPPAAAEDEALRELLARLTATCDTLAQALHEAPKASDFQPLADHLYEFAQVAPQLLQSLHELSEGLAAVRSSFDDALLRMPRPEEYEPLAEPLRRFARASPDLIAAVGELRAALASRGGGAPRPPSGPEAGTRPRLEQVLAEMGQARGTILEALDTLPRDQEYGAVARQLRELATVSPSLMEWLSQVPKVSTPLAASARSLQDAAASLGTAHDRLAHAVRDLWPED